ncbi:sulfite exporter TauE/SafE family protein [Muricoccus radiodurans]|uniref:sulfite exporter TauE/SafE family protein n=1 Tax=Muricoccus radiodurans TaxID=2231721 RepID=UPI003CEBCE3F
MDTTRFLVSAMTFLLAGFVKGVIGVGMPTVSMGILGSLMPPAQAAALLVVPSFVTNVWQMVGVPSLGALARRLLPLLLSVFVGTWLGSGWLTGAGTGMAMAALGAALVAYAGFGLAAVTLPRVPARHEWWLGATTGAATGLITAATDVFVIPAVPYLGTLGLSRDALVGAMGMSFLASTVALATVLGAEGAMAGGIAWGSALALLPALVGMGLGNAVRRRVRPETFRRWFFLALLVLGGQLLWRGVAGP